MNTLNLSSRLLLPLAAALLFAVMPAPAGAKRDGGFHLGGGGRGNSHGSFRGGGHSKLFGGGRSNPHFNSKPHFSSSWHGNRDRSGGWTAPGKGPWFDGGSKNRGNSFAADGYRGGRAGWNTRGDESAYRGGGSFAPGRYENQQRGKDFARNNLFAGPDRSGQGSRQYQGFSRGVRSNDQGGSRRFENFSGRSMNASSRAWGNGAPGGWHSFGYGYRGGTNAASNFRSNLRTDGQWHSFGPSRREGFDHNGAQFYGGGRVADASSNMARGSFNFRRLQNISESQGFDAWAGHSGFSNFSPGYGQGGFRSSRFGGVALGNSYGNGFANSSGYSGNSLLNSGYSLLPNLPVGGLLRLGTLGGSLLYGGLLAGPAISLASNLIGAGVSAIESSQADGGAGNGADANAFDSVPSGYPPVVPGGFYPCAVSLGGPCGRVFYPASSGGSDGYVRGGFYSRPSAPGYFFSVAGGN